MTRSSPEFGTNFLPSVVSGQRQALFDVMRTRITEAFAGGGIGCQGAAYSPWSQYFVTTASGALVGNYTYRSLGDQRITVSALAPVPAGETKGDVNLFVNFRREGASGEYFMVEVAYDANDTTKAHSQMLGYPGFVNFVDDTTSVEIWFVRNEYSFLFIVHQGGSWFTLGWLCSDRSHLAPATRGIARSITANSAGASKTFALDRDISASIKLGQRVWVMDRGFAGVNPLPTPNQEVCIVSGITSNSITVVSLANAHGDGGTSKVTVIGLDPLMFGSWMQTVYIRGFWDMLANFGAQQYQLLVTNYEEGVHDPAFSDQYVGFKPFLYMTSQGVRGGDDGHMIAWPVGTQVDKDLMQVNFDPTLAYKIFPSIPINSTWALSIGPGAS